MTPQKAFTASVFHDTNGSAWAGSSGSRCEPILLAGVSQSSLHRRWFRTGAIHCPVVVSAQTLDSHAIAAARAARPPSSRRWFHDGPRRPADPRTRRRR